MVHEVAPAVHAGNNTNCLAVGAGGAEADRRRRTEAGGASAREEEEEAEEAQESRQDEARFWRQDVLESRRQEKQYVYTRNPIVEVEGQAAAADQGSGLPADQADVIQERASLAAQRQVLESQLRRDLSAGDLQGGDLVAEAVTDEEASARRARKRRRGRPVRER